MTHRSAALLLSALFALAPITGCAPVGDDLATQHQALTAADEADPAPEGEIMVPIHAHLLSASSVATGVGSSVLDQVIARLNCEFHQTRIRFVVSDVDQTVHPRWAAMTRGSLEEREAKRVLHRGGAASLNLYLASPADGAVWGTPPELLAGAPTLDGVVLSQPVDERVTDEVARWVGLYTSFMRGTGESTTVTERVVYPIVPASEMPGSDPIVNFMDYSDDSCLYGFTAAQGTRLNTSFTAYRLGR